MTRPPIPKPRMKGSGMKSISASPIPTAEPEKTTARPDVSIVRDDRVLLRASLGQLLAVAVDDEERVVDRDPEADEHDEVLQVGRQLHEVGDDPDDPERRRDRRSSEHEGQEERERPEDEDEDEERDRDGDEELADLQVLGEDRVEVVLDRRLSGDQDLGARDLPDRRPHVVRVALGVGGLEVRDDQRRHDGVRDRLHAGDLGGGKLGGGPGGRLLHGADEALRRPGLAAHDDRERARRLLPEVVLQDPLGPGRVGAGERETVGEEVGQAVTSPPRRRRRSPPRRRRPPSGTGSSAESSAPSVSHSRLQS